MCVCAVFIVGQGCNGSQAHFVYCLFSVFYKGGSEDWDMECEEHFRGFGARGAACDLVSLHWDLQTFIFLQVHNNLNLLFTFVVCLRFYLMWFILETSALICVYVDKAVLPWLLRSKYINKPTMQNEEKYRKCSYIYICMYIFVYAYTIWKWGGPYGMLNTWCWLATDHLHLTNHRKR